MKRLLSRLDRAGRLLENAALAVLLATLLVLAVGQIVLREVFSTGFIWADELIRLLVLWLAMVGSVAACRDNRHIRIDALSHVLPARAVVLVRVVVDLFAAAVCAVIAWHACRYLVLEIEFGDAVLVDTPAWLAHVIVPLAFLLLAYRFLVLTGIHVLAARELHADAPGSDAPP
ncbi:MAG TPA: TRAP transporter small permease [Woeseiaceae bacterium]|nr:TRAP transporter small permease [Woeseiaceae bacterium]